MTLYTDCSTYNEPTENKTPGTFKLTKQIIILQIYSKSTQTLNQRELQYSDFDVPKRNKA